MQVIRIFGHFLFAALLMTAVRPANAMIKVCDGLRQSCTPQPDGNCYLTFTLECHYEPDNRDLYNAQNDLLGNRPRDVIGGSSGGGVAHGMTGATPSTDTKVAQDVRGQAKKSPCDDPTTDHPVEIASGNKILPELDFSFSVQGYPLYHMRSYDKQLQRDGMFGVKWASNFERGLSFELNSTYCPLSLSALPSCGFDRSTSGKIYQLREGGYATPYSPDGSGHWVNGAGGTISKVSGGWIFVDTDGSIESYDDYGRPVTVLNERHIGWVYAYNTSNKLQTVTHTSGRQLSFTWSGNHVTSITLPGGVAYGYGYNASGYLTSVVYPGNTGTRTYFYENSAQPGGLTGIAINGTRYSRYAYQADGKAAWSGLEAGVERSNFAYTATSTDVTNAIGQTTHYDIAEVNGTRKVLGVTRPETGTCSSGIVETFYNSNGDVEHTVDGLGVKTFYSYDNDKRLIQTIEGIGPNGEADQQLITNYDWDPAIKSRLSGIRVYSGTNADYIRQTTYTYYADGDARARLLASASVINRSSIGLANQVLTTTYDYTIQNSGLIATMTIDGPISGNGDAVTYTYDSAGNLSSIANSLGHTDSYSSYNFYGQPGHTVTANGAVTDYTYNARGQVLTEAHTINGVVSTTTTGYDDRGRLSYVGTPDGEYLEYGYDQYDRTISISRRHSINTNNPAIYDEYQIESRGFTYNLLSQVLTDTISSIYGGYQYDDPSNQGPASGFENVTPQLNRTYEYDAGGFLSKRKGDHGQVLTYTYNANGDVATMTDALNHTTTYGYDRFRRQNYVKDAAGGQTLTVYKPQGTLDHVTDPRGLTTGYAFDGLGQLWAQTSPDTGNTTFTYNSAGQKTGMTRNDGSGLAYSYDGLGRLTWYGASSSVGRTFTYDSCQNGKGRLCAAQHRDGNTVNSRDFGYSVDGLITVAHDWTPTTDDWTGYSYDGMGRLAGINYPSGVAIGYGYSNGHLTTMTKTIGGATSTIATMDGFMAFGPPTSISYGNNTRRYVGFDTDGHISGIQSLGPNGWGNAIQGLTYGYDAADRMTSITNGIDSSLNQTYGYDALSRLTSVQATNANQALTYDASNNLTRHQWLTVDQSHTVDASSNRVTYDAISYGYDGRGNRQTQNWGGSTATYTYDGFNQLAQVSRDVASTYMSVVVGNVNHPAGTTTYTTNALDQRVAKSGAMGSSRFIYGGQNQLLAEYTNGVWTSYLWNDSELMGLVRNGVTYYVHGDHLGRPEIVTNGSGSVVWRAKNYPQDRLVVQDNIGGLNIGFPGQYYDAETGLWYNGFRYYDSRLGKYTQPDPIGLASGINGYAYVEGNPISSIDPLGLDDFSAILYGAGVIDRMPERRGRLPDYVKVSFSMYVFNVSFARARNGQVYGAIGIARPYPHPVSAGASVTVGWLNTPCKPSATKLNRFMTGPGLATTAAYVDVGGGVTYSPGEGSATEVGFGEGVSIAPSNLSGGLSGDYGFTIGKPGMGWTW